MRHFLRYGAAFAVLALAACDDQTQVPPPPPPDSYQGPPPPPGIPPTHGNP